MPWARVQSRQNFLHAQLGKSFEGVQCYWAIYLQLEHVTRTEAKIRELFDISAGWMHFYGLNGSCNVARHIIYLCIVKTFSVSRVVVDSSFRQYLILVLHATGQHAVVCVVSFKSQCSFLIYNIWTVNRILTRNEIKKRRGKSRRFNAEISPR